MTIWHLHLLNARNALTGVMADIRATAREAVARTGAHVDLPRFDLVVRAADRTLPDWGMSGTAPACGVIEITLNPERFSHDHLQRLLVRQMHHLLRWDGPGYGESLGEVLVTEGLAGHFVTQVLGGTPDPWDVARPGSGSLRQAGNLWARRDFEFSEWFLGRGKMRKWTGYGIGHLLVAEHLVQFPDDDAAALAATPADGFRPALRRLLAIEGVEEPEVVDPEVEVPEVGEPVAESDQIASRDAGGQAPRTPQEG